MFFKLFRMETRRGSPNFPNHIAINNVAARIALLLLPVFAQQPRGAPSVYWIRQPGLFGGLGPGRLVLCHTLRERTFVACLGHLGRFQTDIERAGYASGGFELGGGAAKAETDVRELAQRTLKHGGFGS
jgi:hypothetical protein